MKTNDYASQILATFPTAAEYVADLVFTQQRDGKEFPPAAERQHDALWRIYAAQRDSDPVAELAARNDYRRACDERWGLAA